MTGRRWRPPTRRGATQYVREPTRVIPRNGYSVTLISPNNGATFREPRPTISLIPLSILGDPVDVQIEWRTAPPSAMPIPVMTSEDLSLSSGDTHNFQPPSDLTFTTWWYRARAGSKATNRWSDWTTDLRQLSVQPVLGSTAEYIDSNVGISTSAHFDAVAYLDLNVGRDIVPALDAVVSYTDLNVGISPVWKLTARYLDLNIGPMFGPHTTTFYSDLNVISARPEPVIWWIRPEQGREGYVFNIFGHGFGSFENEYDGVVMLGEFVCPIARWEIVPPAGDGPYEIIHGAALEPDVITPEHGWIVAVVPSGAVSSMVRVILESGEE